MVDIEQFKQTSDKYENAVLKRRITKKLSEHFKDDKLETQTFYNDKGEKEVTYKEFPFFSPLKIKRDAVKKKGTLKKNDDFESDSDASSSGKESLASVDFEI